MLFRLKPLKRDDGRGVLIKMAEKNINTRIIQKHDTEANWNAATNFIPKQGEIIVYEIDANHDTPRFKVGNGTANIKSLPFADKNYLTSANISTMVTAPVQFTAANQIVLSNGVNRQVKGSGKYIETAITSNTSGNIPTSGAVANLVSSGINELGAAVNKNIGLAEDRITNLEANWADIVDVPIQMEGGNVLGEVLGITGQGPITIPVVSGPTGPTGATPNINITANIDNRFEGSPTVSVAKSGDTFDFTFFNLKGSVGDTGPIGPTGPTGPTGPGGGIGPTGVSGAGVIYYYAAGLIASMENLPQTIEIAPDDAALTIPDGKEIMLGDLVIVDTGIWGYVYAYYVSNITETEITITKIAKLSGANGSVGPTGATGPTGWTYVPNISSNGELTWIETQDKGEIPPSINIIGPTGPAGAEASVIVDIGTITEDVDIPDEDIIINLSTEKVQEITSAIDSGKSVVLDTIIGGTEMPTHLFFIQCGTLDLSTAMSGAKLLYFMSSWDFSYSSSSGVIMGGITVAPSQTSQLIINKLGFTFASGRGNAINKMISQKWIEDIFFNGSIELGSNSNAAGALSIAIGENASTMAAADATYGDSISIGRNTYSYDHSIAIGSNVSLKVPNSVGIGANANAGSHGVAVGFSANALEISSIAIGPGAYTVYPGSTSNGAAIAIGDNAGASAPGCIQLGRGTCSLSNRFQVWNYPLLDKDTGKIIAERIQVDDGEL